MKKPIHIILLSFCSGFAGSLFLYAIQYVGSGYVQNNLQTIPEYSQNVRTASNTAILPSNIDFVKASEISTKSVVYIKTVSDAKANDYDVFEYYFGGGQRGPVLSSGSGVIFTGDGYIVTNNHVIENAEVIEVIHEKKSYQAKIVGTDPSSDLAILKIEAQNLPNIKLGRSKDLRVGEWVIAVGNPFNLTSTVTAGIVSAKGRNINLLGGRFPLESFIQTDAAINPGNSGGALVNINGELVGINTAILSRTGSYTGYGFAVPVDIVAKIFNDLIQFGSVQQAFLGVEVSDISTELEKKYNLSLKSYDGAIITELQYGGIGEKAGLKSGDIILKVNEDTIVGKGGFEEQMSYYRPGDKVRVVYMRGGSINEVQITLENREGNTDVIKSEVYFSETLGADLENLSKLEKDKLKLNTGVRVVKVRGGLFARLRIQDDFIVVAVNGKEVNSPKELEETFKRVGGRVVIEGISSDGVRGYYQFYF